MPRPEILFTIVVQIAVIVHLLKTGRNRGWIFLIIFVPMIGAVIYFIVEILPELTGSLAFRRAKRNLIQTIDPGQNLRRESMEYQRSQNIDSTRNYADELSQLGRYDEAIELYESGLKGVFEHEPTLLLGLANTWFMKKDYTRARELLDRLTEHNPDFKSADGHLLYARALEGEGDTEKALAEYQSVSNYFPGVEARFRYGSLLQKSGRKQQADQVFQQILEDAELGPKHFRREQKPWLDEVRRAMS